MTTGGLAILNTVQLIRGTGADMANYDRWFERRGKDLLTAIQAHCADRDIAAAVRDISNGCHKGLLQMVKADRLDEAADALVDVLEGLAYQVKMRLDAHEETERKDDEI